ncbi:MAG: peptidase [Planctomycetota bacterium]|nr:MAG: peptidase [Planctomycetota bacterium]REJ98651.1 MAG: peptidase [Planctomycetota bacterium]
MPRLRILTNLAVGLLVGLLVFGDLAGAAKVRLDNGQLLTGNVANIKSMVEADRVADENNSIVMVDDGLRRTFVSLNRIQEVINAAADPEEVFVLKHHRLAQTGKPLAAMGAVVETTPWSVFGRRTMTIQTADGPKSIVQGITKITPRYYEVRSVYAEAADRILLDQRYATSTLPSELVRQIVYRSINKRDPDDRLRVAEFFLQGRRYREAEKELAGIVRDFPKLDGLDFLRQQITQLKAREALVEIRRRQSSGQIAFAQRILESFPQEDIAGETQEEVRQLIKAHRGSTQRLGALREDLQARLEQLAATEQARFRPIVAEIVAELRPSNINRLATYTRLASDPTQSDVEKLALAASGWLVGADEAVPNVAISTSLFEVRNRIRDYLLQDVKPERREILKKIRSEEAGSPRLVAALLAHMTPPYALPEPHAEIEGLFELTVPGRGKEADVTYYVQVPPEYDPYRRYPTIVTLHSAFTTPELQIDWWAGGRSKQTGMRLGQGTRHGYIVVAPAWAREDQRQYGYSRREHLAVLDALRDACRRFSIDTDRIFLSGHSMGADAAWDMGLAHPDLWAGVLPIVGEVDSNRFNFNALYWKNAQHVPFYFVGGTLDGLKSVKNAVEFNRLLGRRGFDVTVVEYLGRGQESYSDEVLRLFEWMNLKKRNFYPEEFKASTFRSFDNFFWYLEVDRFLDGQVKDPIDWGNRGGRALKVGGSIRKMNDGKTIVRVRSGGGPTIVWLSPELVNFEKPIVVSATNAGRRVRNPRPDVGAMLEDVRTRGDRQHPFWARVEFGLDR